MPGWTVRLNEFAQIKGRWGNIVRCLLAHPGRRYLAREIADVIYADREDGGENVADILNHGDHNIVEEIAEAPDPLGYEARYALIKTVPQVAASR